MMRFIAIGCIAAAVALSNTGNSEKALHVKRETKLEEESLSHVDVRCEVLHHLNSTGFYKLCINRKSACCSEETTPGLPERNDEATRKIVATSFGLTDGDAGLKSRLSQQLRNSYCACFAKSGCLTSKDAKRVGLTGCPAHGAGARIWGVTDT